MENKKPIKLGFIGLGNIFPTHLLAVLLIQKKYEFRPIKLFFLDINQKACEKAL